MTAQRRLAGDRTRRAFSPAGAVDTVVIGAGHSGLAMSRCLDERGIDHVVLERGEIANAWRQERWESLRLLTPNWQTRLPGYAYAGPDPDGFMSRQDVVDFVSGYARAIAAPVRIGTTVRSVRPGNRGYRVITDRGTWRCRSVVLASGAFSQPWLPAVSAELPAAIAQVTASRYRSPAALPEGGVLVVGASATGLQLAAEIHASGRPVTLAVGEHVRLPRSYRGRDIQWWLDVIGILDQRYDEVDDIERARGVPSPQLVGTTPRATLDLNALVARGVRLMGRLTGVRDGRAQFSGSLRNQCALADLKMQRLLGRIEQWIASNGAGEGFEPPEVFAPTRVEVSPGLELDLTRGVIASVVWATGFRPDYSWLDLPVLDRKGRLRHQGGVVEAPGIYAMGLNFMRRRKSSFIHGAGDDAADLSAHLAAYLDGARAGAARVWLGRDAVTLAGSPAVT